MRLTRRGWGLVFALALTVSFTVGLLTADWCWFGYCGTP